MDDEGRAAAGNTQLLTYGTWHLKTAASHPCDCLSEDSPGLRGTGSLVMVGLAPHAPCRPRPFAGCTNTVPQCQGLSPTPSLPVFPEEGGLEPKAAVRKELSDMDYLKSKVVRAESPSSSEEEEEEEESEDEAVNCDEGSEAEEEDPCAAPTRQGQERTGPGPEQGTLSGTKKPQEASAQVCGSGWVWGSGSRLVVHHVLAHVSYRPQTWLHISALPLAL